MSDLKPMHADEREIVGFNGAPLVGCGRSLPVVRRSSDGMYCVLDLARGGAALSWHSQDEANAFAQAGRWTRLREPLPLPRSCISEADARLSRQPMVVYAKQPFLDAAGQGAWPARSHDEGFYWRHIEHSDDSTEAACGSSAAVEALLDDWATLLNRRFDALHQQGHDPTSLKRMADFMLCSAKNRSLRWQAYLRLAMVQEPERVRQTFDALVRHEPLNVTVHESRVTTVQKDGESRKHFSGASVDPTDACKHIRTPDKSSPKPRLKLRQIVGSPFRKGGFGGGRGACRAGLGGGCRPAGASPSRFRR